MTDSSHQFVAGLQPSPRSLFAALLLALGFFGNLNAAVVSLNPSQDNSIYSESDSSNALGGLFTGVTNGGNTRRALLQFDLSASGIPTNATINSVVLTLTQTKIGPAGNATFELRRVSSQWGEGTSSGSGSGAAATTNDATWNFRLFSSSSWATAGGDFLGTSGTTSFGTTNTNYSFSSQAGMVADIQYWLANPGSNFGWILKATTESGVSARELGSRESAGGQRPTLVINYTAVPEPAAAALLLVGCAWTLLRRDRRAV